MGTGGVQAPTCHFQKHVGDFATIGAEPTLRKALKRATSIETGELRPGPAAGIGSEDPIPTFVQVIAAEDRGFEPLRAFTPNPLSKRAP